jgi:chaperonin GroES
MTKDIKGTVTVLGARVLVQRDARPEEPRTPGGIIIPGQATRDPLTGTVLVVGTEVPPGGVAEGARVVWGRYGGTDLRVDGLALTLVDVRDLLATVAEADVSVTV